MNGHQGSPRVPTCVPTCVLPIWCMLGQQMTVILYAPYAHHTHTTLFLSSGMASFAAYGSIMCTVSAPQLQVTRIRGTNLEHKHMLACSHWTNQDGVQDLVMVFALCRANINDLPLEICTRHKKKKKKNTTKRTTLKTYYKVCNIGMNRLNYTQWEISEIRKKTCWWVLVVVVVQRRGRRPRRSPGPWLNS